MPSLCGYTWIDPIDQAVQGVAGETGTPLDLAYAFVAVESGFDSQACGDRVYVYDHVYYGAADGVPGAVVFDPASSVGFWVAWECARSPGTYGFSHGLLQLHTGGGQGTGMLRSELLDPWTNLRRGLPPIAAAHRAVWSPTIDPYEYLYQVAIRSGHPGFVARDDYRIQRTYTVWRCIADALAIGGPAPSPPPPAPGPAPIPTNLQVATPVCSDFPYSVTLSWENPSPELWVDISLDPAFSGFNNKRVDGQLSTGAPEGFSLGLVLEPEKAFYWRLWNGAVHVEGDPWNVIACTLPGGVPPEVRGGSREELLFLRGLGCFSALVRLPWLLRPGRISRLTRVTGPSLYSRRVP